MIDNIGYSTNSSSSHLIIQADPDVKYRNNWLNYGCFGWDNFTLVTRLAKENYLTAILSSNIDDDLLTKPFCSEYGVEYVGIRDRYIDHQSLIILPFTGGKPNKTYWETLKRYLLRDDVIILGGNDNDIETHKYENGTDNYLQKIFPYPLFIDIEKVRCIEGADYMVFFQESRYGEPIKIRCDKRDIPYKDKGKVNIDDLTELEIVDMKITDRCNENCRFCYQDSSRDGKNGNSLYIKEVVYQLSKKNVFEIALGGGDVLNFSLLEYILDNNLISFNFSTSSLDFVYDITKYKLIDQYISAFALSVTNEFQLKTDFHYLKKIETKCRKYVHHVLGTLPISEFRELLRDCKDAYIPLILLKYKRIGRGTNYTPFNDIADWKKAVQDLGGMVSVDSCLLSEVQDIKNIRKGVTDRCDAGKCTMYLDMVKYEAAPCSFYPERFQFPPEIIKRPDFISSIWNKIRGMTRECPHGFCDLNNGDK